MQIIKNILDYIWPCFCLSCQKEGHLFCPDCQKKLNLLPLDYQAWDNNDFAFQHCYVCLDYHQSIVQKLIKTFKYQYIQNLSEIFVDILATRITELNLPNNTIICNIPLHAKKKKQRGFDQTEILAKNLSQKINLVYYPLLQRNRFTHPQAQLDKTARQQNVSDAFSINKNISNIEAEMIILIDDVATTGTTLNEAAKVLKKHFNAQVITLVIAKN